MCQSVIYNDETGYHSFHSLSWGELINKYDELKNNKNVYNLRIHDYEYDVDYIDGRWEQRESLIGWCRK